MNMVGSKVAIVTGCGRLRGIFRAAAVSLAKLVSDVVVTGTGRKPENYPDDEKAIGWRDIESVADLVRAEGRRALPLVADVTNRDHVKNMIDQSIKELGRIDILINNAAYARAEDRVPILDLNEDTFQKVVDIKITGTFLCTKGVVEHMIKQGDGGKIVNISSAAGKRGSANFLAYNAANFGIVGMTQSMAKELGPHNINVNCVCPGAVDTSRMDVVRDDWDTMAANTPIGRNGTDDEVGDFCAYLCTEASSWIHGQSINQNGGSVMEH